MSEIANVEQAANWDGHEGEHWRAYAAQYDNILRDHLTQLLRAARIGEPETVLDIGCGNGRSTIEAAQAASAGHAVGVDLSSAMLDQARAAAAAAGCTNVEFVQADAQVHPFDRGAFDVAISRFGVMFFADPVAAFTNVGGALKPGGRIAWIVWRPLPESEYFGEVREALAVGRDLPLPSSGVPGPFGLADRDFTVRTLTAAGFADVGMEAVNIAYPVGADADAAFEFVRMSGFARFATQDLDDADRDRAFDNLRGTIDAHAGAEGVTFDSACWLVTATRAV